MRRLIFGLVLATATVAFAPAAMHASEPSDAIRTEERAAPAGTGTTDEPASPDDHTDTSPPYVMIALTTVLVAGGCLYLLFRRGSLAYRARQDEDRPSEA